MDPLSNVAPKIGDNVIIGQNDEGVTPGTPGVITDYSLGNDPVYRIATNSASMQVILYPHQFDVLRPSQSAWEGKLTGYGRPVLTGVDLAAPEEPESNPEPKAKKNILNILNF